MGTPRKILRWLSITVFAVLASRTQSASIASAISASANPCTAQVLDNFSNLHCSSLKDENELKSILKNVTEHIAILEVDRLNWDTIPRSSFQNVSVHTLIIANSTFQSFLNHTDQTALFRPMHHLSLENVTFSTVPDWEQFSPFQQLHVFSVYNSTLRRDVTSDFGHHLSKSLESVTIAECNVTEIAADSFRELKNLTYLRISHNKIRNFPKLTLTRSPKLEHLRLDYNKIHSLEGGVFDELINLKTLSLSNNSLSTLPQEVFGSVWKETVHLELRDNPIKCDCRIQWIVTHPTQPKTLIGACSHPKRLYGRKLRDLTVHDLRC